MVFQGGQDAVVWRVHLPARRADVWNLIATDQGRAHFWAESAIETAGEIDFRFPNGLTWRATILGRDEPVLLAVRYIGGSTATFALADDGSGGTDLSLREEGVPRADRTEVIAGWVSVLAALKAAVLGVDLRNHDPARTWDQGFVEN